MSIQRRILIALGSVIGLLVAYYLLSPLFIDRVVEEQLPTAEQPAAGEPASAPEQAPLSPQATASMQAAMNEPDTLMEEPMPPGDLAQTQILARGEFYDLAHEGTGTATVYQLQDGSRVLRFEDFEVLNGPNLHVWLVPQDPVPDTVGVELQGYLDLGALKGNIGSQNYPLPPDLVLEEYASVVIWCVPFRVAFNAAPLAGP